MPTLEAVVESPWVPVTTWVPLPDQPWPDFVILSGSTPLAEVGLIVAQLTVYGRQDKTAVSMERLLQEPDHILPGGLRAIEPPVMIAPSCCCGLESWREWLDLLEKGASPWLGHDPAPWVETVGETFVLHSDGGLGEAGIEPERQIRFSRAELDSALRRVQAELIGFLSRLAEWARSQQPSYAENLVRAFDRWFRISKGEEEFLPR